MKNNDSYSVIRSSTLSWLLEKVRQDDNLRDIPEEVAIDLGKAIKTGAVKVQSIEEKLRTLGPVLSIEQHIQFLLEDKDIDLPSDPSSSKFWNLVVNVVHKMLINEAEGVLTLIGGNENGK